MAHWIGFLVVFHFLGVAGYRAKLDPPPGPPICASVSGELSELVRVQPKPETNALSSGLFRSFRMPNVCIALDGGGASRSGATLAMTVDEEWVLKKIKYEERISLLGLMNLGGNKYRQRMRQETLMVPNVFLSLKYNAVIMPNFIHEAEAVSRSVFSTNAHIDKYDVKPAQVRRKSEERGALLTRMNSSNWRPVSDNTLKCKVPEMRQGEHGSGQSLQHGGECWARLVTSLKYDILALHDWRSIDVFGVPLDFVDYSLVFMIAHAPNLSLESFEVNVEKGIIPANCVVSAHAGIPTLLCVRLLDYLMQFTAARKLESLVKHDKWLNYGAATQELLDCVGDLRAPNCSQYLNLV